MVVQQLIVRVVIPDMVTKQQVSDRVIAAGIPFLFTYFVTAVIVIILHFANVDFTVKPRQNMKEIMRNLYWFGAATLFSIYPPFYYGIPQAIIGFLTIIPWFIMVILSFIDVDAGGRRLWTIAQGIYNFFIFVWILLALIYGYKWSDEAEDTL